MEIARLQIAVDSTQAKNAGKDLQVLEGSAKSVTKEASAMGKAIGAAAAAFATGALVNWISATTKGIAELEKFSRLAGSSAEQFQAVSFGAERFGVGADKLSDILKDVNDKVGDFLQTGAGPMADFFENIAPRVGVTADNFRNLSGPDALQLYVSSLERANVSQAEMTFFMEAIANDATLLIPLFANGGAELSRFADEAERLGLILDTETIQQAKLFNDSLATMQAVTAGVGKRVVADMLPAMNDLTGTMIELGTQTNAANVAADIIGGTLKGLATVAIAIGAAFKTTGAAIGAVAAALVQAAQGDFRAAWETIQAGTQDYADTTTEALNRIERLWDGSAAKTAVAATQANTAIKQLGGTTQAVADKPVKQLAARMSEAEKAALANAKAVSDLAEALYQATLPADELAKRQAELRLNEYASAEQIAQVRSLAVELQRLQDIESRKREFGSDPMATIRGNVSPLSGGAFDDQMARYEAERQAEELRYAEQQARLQEAQELRLLSQQEFYILEEQLARENSDRLAQIETAKQQMLLGTGEQVFGDLASMAKTYAGEQSSLYKTMFAASKAFAIAQAAVSIGQGIAMAAANPWPTNLAAMASVAAATASLVGNISSVAMESFEGGGFTGSGPRTGGMDGKGGFMAMVHPNETIIDHTKGQGMGGGVTVNVIESSQKAGTQEKRTDVDGRESVDVFVADIYGDGPRARAMQNAFGLQRQGR